MRKNTKTNVYVKLWTLGMVSAGYLVITILKSELPRILFERLKELSNGSFAHYKTATNYRSKQSHMDLFKFVHSTTLIWISFASPEHCTVNYLCIIF